nr:palmitoyl-acyl carrier protein thioesterase, chloroplastic-like [Ipomoea batatas]
MSTFSYVPNFTIKCSISPREEPKHHNVIGVKINGHSSAAFPGAKVDLLSQNHAVVAATTTPLHPGERLEIRQNIPTKKQLVDPFRQGLIVEGGVGYRQTVVIRSYEVGPDKTATIETILNLLQETALNHVWMSGLLSDGFGATHGMMKNNLIWVVSRMQVQVDNYPIWGEVMEINTWVGASGKNGMRRDWLLTSKATGLVFARATSTWVMMNQQTRRLSKMPDEVRAEISPWFIEKQAIPEENPPKRSDLDMNHHVNNVKYVRWMLETIPDQFLEAHQLSNIILEYRRECGSSDVVQSLCEPNENNNNNISVLNGFSLASGILHQGNGLLESLTRGAFSYTHLLQTEGEEAKSKEIVRGRTSWKRKLPSMPSFPS